MTLKNVCTNNYHAWNELSNINVYDLSNIKTNNRIIILSALYTCEQLD